MPRNSRSALQVHYGCSVLTKRLSLCPQNFLTWHQGFIFGSEHLCCFLFSSQFNGTQHVSQDSPEELQPYPPSYSLGQLWSHDRLSVSYESQQLWRAKHPSPTTSCMMVFLTVLNQRNSVNFSLSFVWAQLFENSMREQSVVGGWFPINR